MVPKNMKVNLNSIPQELVGMNQWVAWKAEYRNSQKAAKIPIDPHTGRSAKSNDPSTWGSFQEAVDLYQKTGLAGIGFMFSETDPFVGIDIDSCISEQMDTEAQKIVDLCHSYTEISPSGSGIHILVKGKLSGGGHRKKGIEIYDRKRFFTMTGNQLTGTPAIIADGGMAIRFLLGEVFSEELADEDRRIIDQAVASGNGRRFKKLWEGDYSDYPSHSEADLAFCQMLAFETDDPARIDRLFRKSKLFRSKWDEPHFADGQTYGHATIVKALKSITGTCHEKAAPAVNIPDFNCTDLGNAERLVHYFGDKIRYCHAWNSWFIWDGTRWLSDETDNIKELAKGTVRRIYDEARHHEDDSKRQTLARHAVSSESSRRISAMIALAQSDHRVSILPEAFDKDIFLLNCANGVLDLRTGVLHPHRKEDYITRMVKVEFDEQAECPRWLAFLDKIMNSNADLISFLQKGAGYSLTGDVSEQCLFILFGSGANGKSTFLRTIGFLTGDYGQQTATETLLVKQKGAIPNDIARLKGARFITASEAEAEQRLAESLIKQMTGNDILSARFLHQEWFDFEPTYKIFLGTNHKPVIKGTDYAIWRRIRLVPFEVTIPEKERDRNLLNKLKEELPGILAWALRGCLQWQANGLGSPQKVQKATADYRNEMDVISDFITECCDTDPAHTVTSKDVYKAYREWCEASGESLMKKNAFGCSLGEKGFVPRRFGKGLRGWEGLRLKSL